MSSDAQPKPDTKPEPPTRGRSLDRIKAALPFIALLGTAATVLTFFGFRHERQKRLVWEYVSVTPVVNPTIGEVEKTKVQYDGREIKQLTAVTGRLVSSGELAVPGQRQKDEQPEQLRFGGGKLKLLNAIVTAKSNTRTGQDLGALKAECRMAGDALLIEHDILNPGDAVTVRVLLEGDPGDAAQLPPLDCQIADTEFSTKYPESRPPVRPVVYFHVPRFWEYVILALASLAAGFFFAGVVALSAEVYRELVPSKATVGGWEKQIADALDPGFVADSTRTKVLLSDDEASEWVAAVEGKPDARWFDETPGLQKLLAAPAVAERLKAHNTTSANAAGLIQQSLRRRLREVVADRLYYKLAAPFDTRVKRAVGELTIGDAEHLDGYLARVARVAKATIIPETFGQRLRAVNKGDLIGPVVILVFAVATSLVLAGSWESLLRGY